MGFVLPDCDRREFTDRDGVNAVTSLTWDRGAGPRVSILREPHRGTTLRLADGPACRQIAILIGRDRRDVSGFAEGGLVVRRLAQISPSSDVHMLL
jgi:hypothetical protein